MLVVVYFTRPVCSLGSVLCCDIVEAHACWTRQFWFWYLIFLGAARSVGVYSLALPAAAHLCIGYLCSQIL